MARPLGPDPGLFLGALGLGVLATTAYRVLVLNQPEAELMGLFGLVALAVNVAAAAVLIPHRTGDANVRAVWLFSRNDAIGNAAVVVAAGLVWLTGTAWPDLAVAAVIAGLFLQSSGRSCATRAAICARRCRPGRAMSAGRLWPGALVAAGVLLLDQTSKALADGFDAALLGRGGDPRPLRLECSRPAR